MTDVDFYVAVGLTGWLFPTNLFLLCCTTAWLSFVTASTLRAVASRRFDHLLSVEQIRRDAARLQLDSSNAHDDGKVKLVEAEARKIEAEARRTEAEAKKATAEAEIAAAERARVEACSALKEITS